MAENSRLRVNNSRVGGGGGAAVAGASNMSDTENESEVNQSQDEENERQSVTKMASVSTPGLPSTHHQDEHHLSIPGEHVDDNGYFDNIHNYGAAFDGEEFEGELPDDLLATIDELQKFPATTNNDNNLSDDASKQSPIFLPPDGPKNPPNTALKGEPFNPNTYTTFNFKLKKLHNLKAASTSSTGDYIIRINFMGRMLGEYMSGPVDLISLSQLSRHTSGISKYLQCPSLTLGHELSMHLRFRDLLDNPVLLTLSVGGKNENDESYSPFAYTCLNIIELIKKTTGKSSKRVTQLWILDRGQLNPESANEHVAGFPLITLEILGSTGLPTSTQLKQGNIMSVIIESMYRLPKEILELSKDPEIYPSMDIHFTLPHSNNEFDSTLVFPGGHFQKVVNLQEAIELGLLDQKQGNEAEEAGAPATAPAPIKKSTSRASLASSSSSLKGKHRGAGGDAGSGSKEMAKDRVIPTATSTSTVFNISDSLLLQQESGKPMLMGENGVPIFMNDERSYRHWASILDFFPEAPYAAAIVTGKQKIPKVHEDIEGIGDINKSGDSWRKHLSSVDTRIVWNSLHKHYIGYEAYQQMLEKLAKQTIWPLEVAVTIQRQNPALAAVAATAAAALKNFNESNMSNFPNASDDDNLQNELAFQMVRRSMQYSPTETLVIYHGVAFVDMTHLLYPGVKRARFIYQLFPFNDVLFKAKTCIAKSAFLQTIRASVINNANSVADLLKKESKQKIIEPPPTHDQQHNKNGPRKSIKNKSKEKMEKRKSKLDPRLSVNNPDNAPSAPIPPLAPPPPPAIPSAHASKLTSKEDLNAVRVSLLNASESTTLPFIIFQIRLSRPLIPSVDEISKHAVKKSLENDIMKFPRKKLINSITAEKAFRSCILEASAEISEEFNMKFLKEFSQEHPTIEEVLDSTQPGTSLASLKKTFLTHLNNSGKYLVLRESLKSSIARIAGQKLVAMQQKLSTNGFSSKRQFQKFLHNLYGFLLNELRSTLNIDSPSTSKANVKVNNINENDANDIADNGAAGDGNVNVNIQDRAKTFTIKQYNIKNNHEHCKSKKLKVESSHNVTMELDTDNNNNNIKPVTTTIMRLSRIANNNENPDHGADDLVSILTDKKTRRKKRRLRKKHSKKYLARRKLLDSLLSFAEEAFAQGDYENAHRLHLERITKSGESSNSWTDFAIMWLARGDDRLAEVALREALLKNTKNIKALIISGIIAARHSDNRGILLLGAALNLVPNSPEILILLAMVHSNLGNDVAAEYYFKKARYIHHLLTGQSLSNIEAEFSSRAPYVPKNNLHASMSLDNDAIAKHHSIRKTSIVESDINLKSGSPSGINKENPGQPSDGLGTFSFNENEDGGGGITKVGTQYTTYTGQEQHLDTKNKNNPIFSQHYHFRTATPEFQFSNLVYEITSAEKSKLPSLGRSIVSTWNVTKCKKVKKQAVDEKNDKHGQKKQSFAGKLATTSGIQNEFGNNTEQDEVGSSTDVTDIWINEKAHNKSHNHRANDQFEGGGEEAEELDGESLAAGNQNKYGTSHPRMSNNLNGGRTSLGTRFPGLPASKHKIFSRRVGSELIWTAYVLLKLKLFDFLDGVLARELAFNPERSIQMLYLRALSLHLRGRDGEAIGFLHEAIEKAPKNKSLWALRGHCYYHLKMYKNSFECFEKSLKFSGRKKENLQLVYLRLGTQCLQKCLVTLAKKIFFEGVHACPSPYMWIAMGNTCYHLKEYQQAEICFAEANKLDNTNPMIWAHLSIVSLALGNQTLAEHSYKWAIRFGLKKGSRLMNQLKQIHRETVDFASAAFQQIPECIPQDYYLQRLGKTHPLAEYKQALSFSENATKLSKEYENFERENELVKRLSSNKPPLDKAVLDQIALAIKNKASKDNYSASRLETLEAVVDAAAEHQEHRLSDATAAEQRESLVSNQSAKSKSAKLATASKSTSRSKSSKKGDGLQSRSKMIKHK